MRQSAWNNDDVALLEEVYAPDAVQTSVYWDGMDITDGRPAVINLAIGTLIISPIAPIVELEAPDGELHWVNFVEMGSQYVPARGAVCNFWARDDQIVRHDCMFSMMCHGGTCTP